MDHLTRTLFRLALALFLVQGIPLLLRDLWDTLIYTRNWHLFISRLFGG